MSSKLCLLAVLAVVCSSVTANWLSVFSNRPPPPSENPLVKSCIAKIDDVYNQCTNLTMTKWKIPLDPVHAPDFGRSLCCSCYMQIDCGLPSIAQRCTAEEIVETHKWVNYVLYDFLSTRADTCKNYPYKQYSTHCNDP